MLITVTQPEIEVGIKMYLKSLGVSLNDASVSMTFTQKRVGGAGIIAEVDIVPANMQILVETGTTVPVVEAPEATEDAEEVVVEEAQDSVAEDVVEEAPAAAPRSLFNR